MDYGVLKCYGFLLGIRSVDGRNVWVTRTDGLPGLWVIRTSTVYDTRNTYMEFDFNLMSVDVPHAEVQ